MMPNAYTFNFAKINSACKAGKFVQVGSIIMCTCISNGIMAYQYFSSKVMGWNKKTTKNIYFFQFFLWNWFTYPLLYLIIRPYISTYPMATLHLKFAVWALTLQWPNRIRPIVAIKGSIVLIVFSCLLNSFYVFCTWYYRCYFIILTP